MKERIAYIDALKGFAILLVVIGHILSWSVDCEGLALHDIIYSFHMPLFAFLGGLFVSLDIGSIRELLIIAKKKAFRLLVPWCAIGGLYAVTCCFRLDSFSLATIHKAMGGYWFLPAFFYCQVFACICMLLFKRVVNFKLRLSLFVLIAFVLTFTPPSPILAKIPYFQGFRDLYLYFAFGGAIKMEPSLQKKMDAEWICPICLLIFIIGNLIETRCHIISIMIACAAIVLFTQIFKRMKGFPQVFITCGIYSLQIYVLHWFLLPSLHPIGQWMQNDILPSSSVFTNSLLIQLLIALIPTAIITMACVICSKSLSKNKYTRILLFGL